MTEQTLKAVELTKELFTDGKFHSEREWDSKIRKADFKPTLKTVLKYLEHEDYSTACDWYSTPIKYFKLK